MGLVSVQPGKASCRPSYRTSQFRFSTVLLLALPLVSMANTPVGPMAMWSMLNPSPGKS